MTETGNHGHGASPIGDWLAEHWSEAGHAVEDLTARIAAGVRDGHLEHRDPPSLAAHIAAASQAPATQPVNLTAAAPAARTEENPVSLSEDLKAIVTRLDTLGEETVTKAEAIAANPETADVFTDLASLATMAGIPAGVIGQVGAGIKALAGLYAEPQPAAPAAPAQ